MTGDQRAAFDEATLLSEAQEVAGLDDFGDDGFRTPLSVLLDSLAVAPLNGLGVAILRGGIVRSLVTRLRTEDWFNRHPEIGDERIDDPIVVVGMMRSGTTLVQRLLAADPRHHAALGWEVGEPAPRPGWSPDEPDPRIPDAVERDEQARQFFPDLVAIHPTDAHEAEEEIVFLADAFLSHVPEASCDVPDYRAWIDEQDFTPAYRHLHRTLQLLQWQKDRRGEHAARWVLKTPAHLGYLDTLTDVFPGAHVVHLHRDPVDTIPSGASLNTALWRMHADDVDPARIGEQWIERMAWTNGRAMRMRDALGAGEESAAFTDIGFAELMAQPLAEVARVYDDVGVDLTSDAAAAMEAWMSGHERSHLPRHRYTAEQFGLSDARIRSTFGDYSERFLAPR